MKPFFGPRLSLYKDLDCFSIMSNDNIDAEIESYPDFSWLMKILDSPSSTEEETENPFEILDEMSNDVNNAALDDICALVDDLSSLEEFSNASPTSIACNAEYVTSVKSQGATCNMDNSLSNAGETCPSNAEEMASSKLVDGNKKQQDCKSVKPKRNRRKPLEAKKLLVKSLIEWLEDPRYNPSAIKWISKSNGTFKITNSVAIASLWGEVKGNKNMTHEKLSRALRHYYIDGTLERKEEGKKKKLCYQFTDAALKKFNVQRT